jgi:hypothetical protein
MIVTMRLSGINAPADALKLANVALNASTIREVRIKKKGE